MRSNIPAPTDANLNFISLEYPYEELRRATNNFSQDNVLGTGTYGCVYRGQLKDGTEVAVKVLQAPKESGFKEEVKVLSKFRHANLVILMGFARNGHERCLVYELLSGGDVSSRLQPSNSLSSFTWHQRLNVALDAALGLSHLHNATPRVFHRDIKDFSLTFSASLTQNILLDRNGSAKVADFGLACLAEHRSLGHFKVQQCSGTIGYADPAYINTSVVTEKTEVYSFGMVLIELLTARPPAVQDPSTGQILYNFQNVQVEDSARIASQLDHRAQWPQNPAITGSLIVLALRCVDQRDHVASGRPRFVDIVSELRQIVRQADQMMQGGVTASTPPSAGAAVRSPSTPASVQPEVRGSSYHYQRSSSAHRRQHEQPQDPGVMVYRKNMDGRRPVAAAGGVGYRATQSPSFPAQVLSPQSQHRRIIHRGPPPPPPPGAASPNVSCYSQVAGHIVTKAASSSDTPTSSASSTPGGHQQNSGSCGEYGMGGRPGGHITQIRHQPSGVAAADRSTNDSVQSYHRMEHVTVRPRAQTRGGVPEHILENSAFQFNHMITGLDRSSLQNQTIREEDFTRGSIEMDPDLAAAVALSKLETRNGDKFYDEDPISIESLNRLTDRDNKAKIDQVCREFGWPQEQVAQAFRVRGTVDAAVEYILEKASTADSVDRASARSTANRHRVQ